MVERLLVTGGASGIGRSIAEHGLAQGWDVVVIDRRRAERGRSVIADLDSTAAVLQTALADGPITRLVNNVGAVFPARLAEQTIVQLDQSHALNLRCAVQCAQGVAEGMSAAGFGRIVNMSSRAALGKELRTAYAAAKAGLIGLTRVWALELAGAGITVNAVGPGPIATELFTAANPPESPHTRAIVSSRIRHRSDPVRLRRAHGGFQPDLSDGGAPPSSASARLGLAQEAHRSALERLCAFQCGQCPFSAPPGMGGVVHDPRSLVDAHDGRGRPRPVQAEVGQATENPRERSLAELASSARTHT